MFKKEKKKFYKLFNLICGFFFFNETLVKNGKTF